MTIMAWTPDLDIRAAMLANARAIVGYHGGDPATEAAFQRLLGPPFAWPLRKAYGAGGVSTCAMVCLGLLRLLGVACVDILDGYADDIASGLAVAIAFARRCRAWQTYAPGLRPDVGDVVQVLGPMHAATVVGWRERPDGTLLCVTVDGGQAHPRDGLQCVALVERPWVDDGTCSRLGGRRVDGWIVLDLLEYRGPVEML